MQPMLSVDFHCHTWFSPDSLVNPANLLVTARQRGIDRLVITDHNTIRGAQAAAELDPGRIIIGEEIMTPQGELLAAFVSEEIPGGLPAVQTIALLRAQQAFISVSHPFDRARHGWELNDLLEILPLVDAIEIYNSRCITPRHNHLARKLAQQYNLAGTAGSDAHTLVEVGAAVMQVPVFKTAADLRSVINQGEICARMSPIWVHLCSTYAKWKKKAGGKKD